MFSVDETKREAARLKITSRDSSARSTPCDCDYRSGDWMPTNTKPNIVWSRRTAKSAGVIARGKIERDAVGKSRQFAGVVVDITERKQTEAALRESESVSGKSQFDAANRWSTTSEGYHDYLTIAGMNTPECRAPALRAGIGRLPAPDDYENTLSILAKQFADRRAV
jgi:hypothetical protein